MKYFKTFIVIGVIFIVATIVSPLLIEALNNKGVINDVWMSFFSSYFRRNIWWFATLTAVLMTIHSTYNIQQNEVKRANDMKRLEVQPIIELKKSVSSGFRNSKEHLTNSLEFTIVNIGFNIGKDVTIGIQSDLGFENDRFSYEFIQPLEKFNFKSKVY